MMKKFFATTTHKILRNIFYLLGGMFIVGTFLPSISMGQQFDNTNFPYDVQGQQYDPGQATTTNIATDIIKPDTQQSTSLLKRLTNLFRLSGTPYDIPGSNAKATDYVKRILNILLGLVSFLSLVMVIFAFYLIFFSKGEEGVTKAKKILIGVGIALAVMGLARFITSFFFNLFTTVTQ